MSNQEQQKQRSIPKLIEDAEKGDIKAQFQLANNYESGKYVEAADEEKSESYFLNIFKRRHCFNPKFKTLELINFRGFKKQKIMMDPKVTIFVGNNGSGKTSLIEAFCMSSSWITALIKNSKGSGKSIDFTDINNSTDVKNGYVISTMNVVDDIDYKLPLAKSKLGIRPQLSNSLLDIKQLASIYQLFNTKDPSFGLPLFAYYSVGRSTEVKKADFKYALENVNSKSWTKLDGYTESFDESKCFREFLTWLARFENIEKNDSEIAANKDIWKEIIELQTKVEMSESFLDMLPKDKKEKVIEEMSADRNKIKDLQQRISKTVTITEIIKQAIYKFMPAIENLRINHSESGVDLIMEKDSVTISALQLSQGEKSLLALTGDIARRLVMLNPLQGQKSLDGKGIVIIDEIDLHLHPRWQQQVVQKLCDTFKNIQFILTTHSPQVLSTVSPESIRVIKNTDRGVEIITPDFSLGSESKMILEDILGVPSRPKNIEEVQDLITYQSLIAADKWDTDKAYELREKLVAWAGDHDPVMMKLDMDVRLRKRRRTNK